jgi:hypothetical protein
MYATHSSGAKFYHTGESSKPDYDPKTFRVKPPDMLNRKVIAWDMEGISLSGLESPQHPVLFGCSADVAAPLTGEYLTTRAMLEYIIAMGTKHPHALHVGYSFKYDANMLIGGLSEKQLIQLHKTNRVTFRFDEEFVWSIHLIPGKMFTVTKRWGKRNSRAKTSVTIYDFFSFFGRSFIATCEDILRDDLTADDRQVITHGKAERGSHSSMEALPEITFYWQREIILMQRVFEKFRDVMYRAGFRLKEWYGPGALANYINATRGIRPKLVGVQTTHDIMPAQVHAATKVAFSGGRFELFRAGRIRRPVYVVDINGAYPYALTKLPSFAAGRWVHTTRPASIELFGVYRIKWRAPNSSPFEKRPMPLFWRDHRGMISYPNVAHGWYMSPEAAIVQQIEGIEILEGWHWETESGEKPWEFLQEMYDTRMRLGKKNLLSIPFKLGPNSLYGKYAQTVGWDQKKLLPPKSHALPVAGWVTSYCRAMLWDVIRRDPSSVIGVETDSVYTTTDPRTLDISIGDGLGQWDIKEYDQMIYMQSGMYHTQSAGSWSGVKSRGMTAREFPIEAMESYLHTLRCDEPWGELELQTKPRFIGVGAAIASSEDFKAIHRSWRPQTRRMRLGETGKRVHVQKACESCQRGVSPDEEAHRLIVNSHSDGETLSFPRSLPWEQAHTAEVEEMRQAKLIEADLIGAK